MIKRNIHKLKIEYQMCVTCKIIHFLVPLLIENQQKCGGINGLTPDNNKNKQNKTKQKQLKLFQWLLVQLNTKSKRKV